MSKQELEVAETILDQLKQSKVNGFPFFAYTGIKKFVLLEDGLLLRLPKNPKHYEKVEIFYDYGQDLYDVSFYKLSVPIESVKGVFFDQLAHLIVEKMGVL